MSDAIAPRTTDDRVDRAYQLMVETVDVRVERLLQYLSDLPMKWRFWLRRTFDVRMLSTTKLLTSRPGRLVHLWQVPWGFSLAELHARLLEESKTSRWVGEMFDAIDDVAYDVLVPTRYDPARSWSPPVGGALAPIDAEPSGGFRMIDVVKVKPCRLESLASFKQRHFVPEARAFGVTLIASGTRVCEPRHLVQVWGLADMESLLAAINAFSERAWYRQMVLGDIVSEEQNLMVPSLHDPNPQFLENRWIYPV